MPHTHQLGKIKTKALNLRHDNANKAMYDRSSSILFCREDFLGGE